jgi:hypothetical protein
MALPAIATPAALTALVGGALTAYNAFSLYNQREAFANQLQSNITFPPDLNRNAAVPFMSMQFKRYQRRSINEQPFYIENMKIRLPIPENLVERTSVTYNNQELGSLIGSVIEASSAGAQDRIATVTGGASLAALRSAPELLASAARRSTNVVGGAALDVAAESARTLSQLTAAAAGALFGITTNPFQVVMFKSPEFRSHTFAWKFTATSLQESEILRQLVETFKYHALPGIDTSGALLFSYPEILEINFRPSDTYLYKFKPCVVKNITVNYAPNSPSFVRSSGAPTSIQMQIDLQEIEILTKADFFRDQRGVYSSSTPLTGRAPPT